MQAELLAATAARVHQRVCSLVEVQGDDTVAGRAFEAEAGAGTMHTYAAATEGGNE